uniref:Uncharacterized protein n=1 Tax=Bracon brevicornis TaxID=1563983 RepID=A0A6V7KC20_9HYME
MPRPVETMEPTQLKPKTETTWKYQDPAKLATSGIYTQDDLKEMRNRIMFPMENTVLLNTIAHKVSSNGTQYANPSLLNAFDEKALQKLADSTWKKTWGSFMWFGTLSAGCIGLAVIIKIGQLVLDTVVHGYTLHRVYGWSVALLGAVCGSITSLLLHMANNNNNNNNNNDNHNNTGLELENIEAAVPREDNPSAPPQPIYPAIQKEEETQPRSFIG